MRLTYLAPLLALTWPATAAIAQTVIKPILPVPAANGVAPPVAVAISVMGQGAVRWGAAICAPADGQSQSTCNRTVASGAQTLFQAEPRTGMKFVGWKGACAGQGPRCFLTPAQNFSLSAEFAPAAQAALVKVRIVIPQGGGSVSTPAFSNPQIACKHPLGGTTSGVCTAEVAQGTRIILNAVTDANVQMGGWQGASSGCTAKSCDFVANGPVTLAPRFVQGAAGMVPLTFRSGATGGLYASPVTKPSALFDCSPESPPSGNQKWERVCTALFPTGSKIELSAALHKSDGSVISPYPGQFGGCGPQLQVKCFIEMKSGKMVQFFKN